MITCGTRYGLILLQEGGAGLSWKQEAPQMDRDDSGGQTLQANSEVPWERKGTGEKELSAE